GEQCVMLYNAIAARMGSDPTGEGRLAEVARAEMKLLVEAGIRYVPGFGHRFHPRDPRAPRLLELVDVAAAAGAVSGRFAAIGRAVEAELAAQKGRPVPMNIDGATGVIFAELGFPPPLSRGLFVLSRAVGALAHAFEEMQSGERNKGPIPRHLTWTYTGPPARPLGRAWRPDFDRLSCFSDARKHPASSARSSSPRKGNAMLTRRHLLCSAALLSAGTALPPSFAVAPARAQSVGLLKLFVPPAPAGGLDQTARAIDQLLG